MTRRQLGDVGLELVSAYERGTLCILKNWLALGGLVPPQTKRFFKMSNHHDIHIYIESEKGKRTMKKIFLKK